MENNNRQGCRWVKASERLPDDWPGKEFYIRFIHDGAKVVGQFHSRYEEIGGHYFSGVKLTCELNEVEWLDESN